MSNKNETVTSANQGDALVHPNLMDEDHREWIKSFIRWRVEECCDLTIEDLINKIAAYAVPGKRQNIGAGEEVERLQNALNDCDGENKPTLSDNPTPVECKDALDFIMSSARNATAS